MSKTKQNETKKIAGPDSDKSKKKQTKREKTADNWRVSHTGEQTKQYLLYLINICQCVCECIIYEMATTYNLKFK